MPRAALGVVAGAISGRFGCEIAGGAGKRASDRHIGYLLDTAIIVVDITSKIRILMGRSDL